MRTEPSKKMIRARQLRMQQKSLDEVAAAVKVTRQGARYLIKMSDRFFKPKIGNYKSYKKYVRGKNGRESGLSAP